MTPSQRAAALVEFALAWPVALLLVLASVEAAVWASEAYAARAASLAGARAGSVAGAGAAVASQVALRVLASSLIGVTPEPWCPGDRSTAPLVWVCAIAKGQAIEVEVGGSAPALVPLVPGGMPLQARIVIEKDQFQP